MNASSATAAGSLAVGAGAGAGAGVDPETGSSSPKLGGDALRPRFPRPYFEGILGGDSGPTPLEVGSAMGPEDRPLDSATDGGGLPLPSSAAVGPEGAPPRSSSAVMSMGPVSDAGRFQLRVNAEVVVFGSTEPGARVTLAGRPVDLRPDGSFTFRCALPDGRFELRLVAVSAQGHGQRGAVLTLRRGTALLGEVEVHRTIDPGLSSPEATPRGVLR